MKPGTAPMTSDLSPVDRLGEIRARLDAATPGPWGVESSHGELWQIGAVLRDRYGDNAITSNDRATVEFIAAARADVGWLLDHIEQLQRDRGELNTLVAEMSEELTGRAAMAAELGRLRNELAACRDSAEFDPNSMIHVYDEMRDERDKAYSESARLRAQRQAVLELCDRVDAAWMGQSRHTGTGMPPVGPLVDTRAVRTALGVDRD